MSEAISQTTRLKLDASYSKDAAEKVLGPITTALTLETDGRLNVSYDLNETRFAELRAALLENDVAIEADWKERLRWMWVDYVELNQLSDQQCVPSWEEAVRDLYVSRYRGRRHGRRDDRRHQWREYPNASAAARDE